MTTKEQVDEFRAKLEIASGRIAKCQNYMSTQKNGFLESNQTTVRGTFLEVFGDLISIATDGELMTGTEVRNRVTAADRYLHRCAGRDDVPVDPQEQLRDLLAILVQGEER